MNLDKLNKPLSELSNANEVALNDLILISKYIGAYDNFVSRNLSVALLLKAGLNSYTIPYLEKILPNYIKKEDTNFESNLSGLQYIKNIKQENGIVDIISGNLATDIGLSNYTKKDDLNCTYFSDNHYISEVKQIDGKIECNFKPLNVFCKKEELTWNEPELIHKNETISAIQQVNGEIKFATVDNSFKITIDPKKYIKSIYSTGYGKLSVEYNDYEPLDFKCENNQYIDSIKYDGHNLQITVKEIDNIWPMKDCLKIMYPVGALYIFAGESEICPLANIPGMSWEWERIEEGKVLQSTNNSKNAGTYINAGLPNLPNHSHSVYIHYGSSGSAGNLPHHGSKSCPHGNTFSTGKNINYADDPIYGKSSTVQPPAILVSIFKRIS